MKKFWIGSVVLLLLFAACSRELEPQQAVSNGFKKSLDQKKTSLSLVLEGRGLTSPETAQEDSDGEAKTTQNEKSAQDSRLRIEITGKSDNAVRDKAKFDGNAAVMLSDAATSLEGRLDVRVIDGEVYMKLVDLKLPQGASPDAANLFTGKWWVLPSDGQNSYFKNFTADQEKLVSDLKQIELFSNASKVAEEEVRGTSSRKYKVDLSPEGLKKMLLAVARLSGNEVPEDEATALEERLRAIRFDGHVWVAKRGGIANRISGDISLKSIDPAEEAPFSLNIDFQTWDFGKKVAVEKPQDATPFNPALLFGLSGLPGLSGSGAVEDQEQVQDAAKTPIDQPLGAEQAR